MSDTKFVCENCIDNLALKKFIRNNAQNTELSCSYCDKEVLAFCEFSEADIEALKDLLKTHDNELIKKYEGLCDIISHEEVQKVLFAYEEVKVISLFLEHSQRNDLRDKLFDHSDCAKIPFKKLASHILECIEREYVQAADACIWQDGEYFPTPDTTSDLIENDLFGQESDLTADLVNWIDTNREGLWVSDPNEEYSDAARLKFTWKQFCNCVKHQARYFFPVIKYNDHVFSGTCNISDYLKLLADELNLVLSISHKDLSIFRVRVNNIPEKPTVTDIGTAPKNKATSNRMSPAGVPMFYGAFDKETAILETIQSTNKLGTVLIGEFVPSRDLRLIDLSKVIEPPDIFEVAPIYCKKPLTVFMRAFLEDFTSSIERDGREHFEYAPTQVVTEFFRHVYRDQNGNTVDGIIYPSAKNGKRAIVLFVENESCVAQLCEERKTKLQLILKTQEIMEYKLSAQIKTSRKRHMSKFL